MANSHIFCQAMGSVGDAVKWYFCIESLGAIKFSPYIKAAVISCRKHTDLVPICLWHDHGDGDATDLMTFFQQYDVKVIFRKSRVYETVRAQTDVVLDCVTAGTHLRYDIPLVEHDDDFVLYADCDIIFNGPIALDDLRPRFFAAAPEFDRNVWTYFNSGVMLMNMEAMRRTADDLLATTIARMKAGFATSHDQSDLNGFYFENWDKLSPEYNWKPYWGDNPDAKIIHFHGPKPADVFRAIQGQHPNPMTNTLVGKDTNGYVACLLKFIEVLNSGGLNFSIENKSGMGFCTPTPSDDG